jgi:hypothetical protein
VECIGGTDVSPKLFLRPKVFVKSNSVLNGKTLLKCMKKGDFNYEE